MENESHYDPTTKIVRGLESACDRASYLPYTILAPSIFLEQYVLASMDIYQT